MNLKEYLLVIHRYAVLHFIRFLLSFKGTGRTIPPTVNKEILQCSATDLARKIRKKEVINVNMQFTLLVSINSLIWQ